MAQIFHMRSKIRQTRAQDVGAKDRTGEHTSNIPLHATRAKENVLVTLC